MDSWYRDQLHQNELILLSESGFTTDQLTLRFLEHFIQHTGAGRDQPPKFLLMDNHGSHLTPEFIDLATRNNIVLFSFPAHLTHCMQPCDVGIFQTIKHWHNKAIQYALENLDFDYTISSFLRDLPDIRSQTLKKTTIKHAFKEAGMWPVNAQKVLQKMSKYMKESTPEPALPALLPSETPRTTQEFRVKWSTLQPKLHNQLSSPTQRQFDSIERGLQSLLDLSDITRAERDLLYTRISDVVRKKPTSRRRVQKGGELTAEYAQQLIKERDQKEKDKWAKKLAKAQKQAKSKEKKELHQLGVLHRRLERQRVKSLKQVLTNDVGAFHLTVPIPDPEKAPLEENILGVHEATIPQGFEAGDPQNWLEGVPFEPYNTTLKTSERWLQYDFVGFEEEDSSSSSSDESFYSIRL
jgi:hypothetical protein